MTTAGDVIQIEDKWYVLATSSRADDRTRVLKHGETFGVFDRLGDIHHVGVAEQGVYHEGARFLSELGLTVNGERPLLLNSTVRTDNSLLQVNLTNPDLMQQGRRHVPTGTVHIARRTFLWQAAHYEELRLFNYGRHEVELELALGFDADYADIFEVRGVTRAARGHLLPPRWQGQILELGYRGLDGVTRRTRIRFGRRPDVHEAGRAVFRLRLPPQEGTRIDFTIAFETGEAPLLETFAGARGELQQVVEARSRQAAEVHTSNEQFNDWVNRSAADLHMLITETEHGPYPYAGVPWYSTPFGRDGIITALQYLWLYPELARGVLAFLAAHQADEEDPRRDAEPGKILHELRHGEMAALGEVPFQRYYGTVDATPLFVMLAGAYYERTGDRPFLEAIWPNIERALEWIDRYGDRDGDGFVEYERRCEHGLANQGWKDSHDSVFHADGRLAEGPIALCEVQGYVYAARRAAAELAGVFGEVERARSLHVQADDLRRRFNEAFWCEELSTFVLALDGDKRPCRVVTSNAGHALFTGIAAEEYARRTGETLLAEPAFNGWGVRTVAKGAPRYNPMSYHNGSVWPHDNALIAAGLARYGYADQALRILTGLFDASIMVDLHRLPELFCGFTRQPGQGPTRYPVACEPQAWAAGAVFHLLQACLGLRFSPRKPQITFSYPRLPAWLDRVEIRNLRVGGGTIDLALRRHPLDVGINVLRKDGDIDVAVIV